MPSASTDISGQNQSYTLTLTKSGTSWTLTATHNGSTSYGAWGTATGTISGGSPSSYSKGYDFRSYNSVTIASGTCNQYGTLTATFDGNNWPYIGSGSVSVSESPPTPTYTHTITYDANGGTGAPSSQSSTTTTQSSFTATLSGTMPTRDRHEFLGWSTSATAKTPSYQPSTQYTFTTQNVTLYAVWKKTSNIDIYLGDVHIERVYLGDEELIVNLGDINL